MKKILFFIIIILIAKNVYSQTRPPDTICLNTGYIFYKYQEYNFVIVLVNDLQKTLDDWNSSGNNKTIDSTTMVGINEPISFFIVYSVDEEKPNLRLSYNITVLNSDGSIINRNLRDDQYLGLRISNGAPEKHEVYIADNLQTIIFNENYNPGNYAFYVDVFDAMKCIGIFKFNFTIGDAMLAGTSFD